MYVWAAIYAASGVFGVMCPLESTDMKVKSRSRIKWSPRLFSGMLFIRGTVLPFRPLLFAPELLDRLLSSARRLLDSSAAAFLASSSAVALVISRLTLLRLYWYAMSSSALAWVVIGTVPSIACFALLQAAWDIFIFSRGGPPSTAGYLFPVPLVRSAGST
jgi:hypothetical protein